MLCTSASIVLLWVTHVFMFGIYASYAAHDALRTIITAEVVVWFIFTKSLRCWRVHRIVTVILYSSRVIAS